MKGSTEQPQYPHRARTAAGTPPHMHPWSLAGPDDGAGGLYGQVWSQGRVHTVPMSAHHRALLARVFGTSADVCGSSWVGSGRLRTPYAPVQTVGAAFVYKRRGGGGGCWL